jgi:hypothetical protein
MPIIIQGLLSTNLMTAGYISQTGASEFASIDPELACLIEL